MGAGECTQVSVKSGSDGQSGLGLRDGVQCIAAKGKIEMGMDTNDGASTGITRRVILQGSLAAGLAAMVPLRAAAAASPATSAVIDTTRTGDPISKNIYGSFFEHIGSLVYDSVWAEVLRDRKFFSAVEPQTQPREKWVPVGPADAVKMDTTSPYVGEQSPVVSLTPSTPRGIQQSGLSLAEKEYVGRLVIAGDPGARVVATLSWGTGQSKIAVAPVNGNWKTVPLAFSCKEATTSGTLQITGTGTGSFKVGAVSLMPADNVKGFRKDTIDLLRGMESGLWRFPGGNYVSAHDWKNAVGDPDKRPPTFDYERNDPQSNDVGTDEFIALCDLLGADPYICVNSGYGEARSAAELVEYVNGAADTPMGRLRAANGHQAPYKVKYWGIGNEMFGYWQKGYMSPPHYMIKHNLFADAMKKADPTITILASGAFPASMTIHRLPFYIDPDTRKIVQPTPVLVEYGSETDWNYRMMKNCWGNFDIFSEHTYGQARRFDLDQGMYVDVAEPVLDSCRRGANYIHSVREDWEKSRKDFPLERDHIKLSIDEWGFQGASGLRGLLAKAMMLHEMFRNTDVITMAAYTTGAGWLSYNRTDSIYSETGLLFLLYRKHFGTTPVNVDGNSPVPAPKWPVGGDQPSVNAGSPTYPLDLSAALSSDGSTLTVAAINATADTQTVNLSLGGFTAKSSGRLWRLSGTSLTAVNRIGQAPQVSVSEEEFDTRENSLAVAPYSVELRAYTRS